MKYYFETKTEIKHCLECPVNSEGTYNCKLQPDADGVPIFFLSWEDQRKGCPLKVERVWVDG